MTDRFSSGRLEAFSDGVFAIAATLLVLEIGVPESGYDDLWEAIRDQRPSYPKGPAPSSKQPEGVRLPRRTAAASSTPPLSRVR